MDKKNTADNKLVKKGGSAFKEFKEFISKGNIFNSLSRTLCSVPGGTVILFSLRSSIILFWYEGIADSSRK